MHPARHEQPRNARRAYRVAAKVQQSGKLQQCAKAYRKERQELAAAELARMVATYRNVH